MVVLKSLEQPKYLVKRLAMVGLGNVVFPSAPQLPNSLALETPQTFAAQFLHASKFQA